MGFFDEISRILSKPEGAVTGAVIGTGNLIRGNQDVRGAAIRKIYNDLQTSSKANPEDEELKQRLVSVEPYLHSADDIGNPLSGIAKGVSRNINPAQAIIEKNSNKFEPGGESISGGEKALGFLANAMADPLTYAGAIPSGIGVKALGEGSKLGKGVDAFLSTEKLAKDAPKIQKLAQLGRQMGQGMTMAGGDLKSGLALGAGLRGFERSILPKLAARTGTQAVEASLEKAAKSSTEIAEDALGTGIAKEADLLDEISPTIEKAVKNKLRSTIAETNPAPPVNGSTANTIGPELDTEAGVKKLQDLIRQPAAATPEAMPDPFDMGPATGPAQPAPFDMSDPYAKTIGAEPRQFKPLYEASPQAVEAAAMHPQTVQAQYNNAPLGPPLPGDMGLGQFGPQMPPPSAQMGGNLGAPHPGGAPTQSSIQQLAAPLPAAQQARPGTALHQVANTNFGEEGLPPGILDQLIRSVAGGNTKANFGKQIDIDPVLAKRIIDALQGSGNTKALNILSKTLKPRM